jgi:hypothetical protein
MVIEHKFDKLSAENARRLCVELNIPGGGEDIDEPVTLAEIYARKNVTAGTSTNGFHNGSTATKNKQPLNKKKRHTRLVFRYLLVAIFLVNSNMM